MSAHAYPNGSSTILALSPWKDICAFPALDVEGESAADTSLGSEPYGAAMHLCKSPGDEEAQARTACGN